MRFISSRDETVELSFQEAALQGRCPKGGILLPANISPINADFLHSLRDKNFVEKMALCLGLFITELSYSELYALCDRAFAEPYFMQPAFVAGPLNPYNVNELLIFAEKGPTGTRHDYANHLAREYYKLYLNPEQTVYLYSDSTLASLLSLEVSVQDSKNFIPFFALDWRTPQQALPHLESFFEETVQRGFYLEGAQSYSEHILFQELDQHLRSAPETGLTLLPADTTSVISLVTQMSLLLIAFAELQERELLEGESDLDIALSCDDLDFALALLYLKGMGLPIGQMIMAEGNNRVFCDFFRTGRYSAKRKFQASIVPSLNRQFHPAFEGLLFELVGRNRSLLKTYLAEYRSSRRFQVDKQVQQSWSQHIVVIFSDDRSITRSCRSLYDRSDYLLDGAACAAFASRQMQMKGVQEAAPILVLSSYNPLWSLELSAKALFGKARKNYDRDDMIAAVWEESGIAIPHALQKWPVSTPEEDATGIFTLRSKELSGMSSTCLWDNIVLPAVEPEEE